METCFANTKDTGEVPFVLAGGCKDLPRLGGAAARRVVRIRRPEIGKLACQAQGERIFAALPRIPSMKKQSFFN